MSALRLVVAAVVTAALTWLVGWWAVIPVALAAGILPARWRMSGGAMALAAATGWGALLALHATSASFGTLLQRMGGVLRVPGVALVVVALLYVALLGWSAAIVGASLAHLTSRRSALPRDDSAERSSSSTRAAIVESSVR